jgi:hypothetical protein
MSKSSVVNDNIFNNEVLSALGDQTYIIDFVFRSTIEETLRKTNWDF